MRFKNLLGIGGAYSPMTEEERERCWKAKPMTAEQRERWKADAARSREYEEWVKRMLALEKELARQREQTEIDAGFADVMRENLIRDLDAQLIDIWADRPSKDRLARYDGDFRRFQKFCAELGKDTKVGDVEVTPFNLSSLPATSELVACYLLDELERGASYQSIRRSYEAIAFAHIAKGVYNPCPDPYSAEPRDLSSRPFASAVVRLARKKYLENKAKKSEQTEQKQTPA